MMNKNYYVLNEKIWEVTGDDYDFTVVTEIDEDGNIKKLGANACDEFGNYIELEDGEEPDFLTISTWWEDGINGNELSNKGFTLEVFNSHGRIDILFNNYFEYFEYFNEDYEDTGDFDIINGKEYKIYRKITED